MNLTPEDAEKIALKNLANIIRKANSGQTLTARELAILEQSASGGPASAASAYARTQGELASRLGISRKTITNHQSDDGAPVTRDDGRYDVAAWSKFLREHQIIDEPETPDAEKTNWKEELQRLKCEELKLKLEIERRDVVPIGEVIAAAGRTITAFRTSLNQVSGRSAQGIVGLKEYDEIKEVIDSEITIVLRQLEGADFLSPPPEEIIGEVAPESDPEPEEGETNVSPVSPAPTPKRSSTKKKFGNSRKAESTKKPKAKRKAKRK